MKHDNTLTTPRLFFAAALLALGSIAGCDDTVEGAKQDAADIDQKVEETTDQLGAQLTEYKSSAKARLATIDEKLDELETKAEHSKEDAREGLEKSIEKLRKERKELADDIDTLEAKSESQWEETKRSMDDRMANLGESIDRELDEIGDAAEEELKD